MTPEAVQTYENHRRIVPLYHVVISALLLLNLGYAVWNLIAHTGFGSLVQVTTAIALILMQFYIRVFPLKAQDRVIRLEEQLRMARVLPADLQPRIGEFTARQLVALRFASDAELPDLARRVLEESIRDGEAIKKLISDWRPDRLRV